MEHSLQKLRDLAELFNSTCPDQFEELQKDYRQPTVRSPDAFIKFLGTGQGTHHIAARGPLNHNSRRVSGPIISSQQGAVWIDPGPDALAVLDTEHFDPRHIDGILVSHAHVDHFGNIACAVEAISGATEIKKKKVVYGNTTAIIGSKGSPAILSDYHKYQILRECRALLPFDQVRIGDIDVKALPCSHRETPDADASLNWRLQFEIGNRACSIVQYDGNVFEVIGKEPSSTVLDIARGEALSSDILIVNVSNHVRVRTSRQNYVSTSGLLYLVRESAAKVIFTTHFGIEMFRLSSDDESRLKDAGFASIAEFQACYVTEEARALGIEKSVIPARDGMIAHINSSWLEIDDLQGETQKIYW